MEEKEGSRSDGSEGSPGKEAASRFSILDSKVHPQPSEGLISGELRIAEVLP